MEIMKENNMKIIAISISKKRGEKKINIPQAELIKNCGIVGDAHSGNWDRQISLLSLESINKMKCKELKLSPGDFAENITTEGLDFSMISVGTRLRLGNEAMIEITKIGKECHNKCSIFYKAGDCIMPREGMFAKVIEEGSIFTNDSIGIVKENVNV